MKYFTIVFIIIMMNFSFSNESIAIVSKIRGKVKLKEMMDRKFKNNVKINSLISTGNQIKTYSNAFAKIIYLDDASIISIYPNTELTFVDSINNGFIKKEIKFSSGTIHVNLMKSQINTFHLTTLFSEAKCNKCSFWLTTDKKNGDRFIRESGEIQIYNSANKNTIGYISDSTLISNNKFGIDIIKTPVTNLKYLESLMLNADEMIIQYKKEIIEAQTIDTINNTVVIKLVNAAKKEREIILQYIY